MFPVELVAKVVITLQVMPLSEVVDAHLRTFNDTLAVYVAVAVEAVEVAVDTEEEVVVELVGQVGIDVSVTWINTPFL